MFGAGEKGKFSGGFDITAFGGLQDGKCMHIFYSSALQLLLTD